MQYLKLKVGDHVPLENQRGIIGPELDGPIWYALTVPPGMEPRARDMLDRKGVHAQYPTRESVHYRRGKKVVRKLPMVTQVVYAQFRHAPQWDVIRYRRIISGVYSRDGWPIEIPYDVVRVVMGMPTVAEELEAARREMLRVRAGDKATLSEGPLAGFLVDVREVKGGRVWFETLTGIKGAADIDKVERWVD